MVLEDACEPEAPDDGRPLQEKQAELNELHERRREAAAELKRPAADACPDHPDAGTVRNRGATWCAAPGCVRRIAA